MGNIFNKPYKLDQISPSNIIEAREQTLGAHLSESKSEKLAKVIFEQLKISHTLHKHFSINIEMPLDADWTKKMSKQYLIRCAKILENAGWKVKICDDLWGIFLSDLTNVLISYKENSFKKKYLFSVSNDHSKLHKTKSFIYQSPVLRYKEDLCVACLDKPPIWYFESCGHQVYCTRCKNHIKSSKCPLCQSEGKILRDPEVIVKNKRVYHK